MIYLMRTYIVILMSSLLTLQAEGITQDEIRLRVFSFSLQDKTKDWIYHVPSTTFTAWTQGHMHS